MRIAQQALRGGVSIHARIHSFAGLRRDG